MSSPFLQDPVEQGARIVRGSLRMARRFRDRQNPLDFPEDILYQRYRFSAEGIQYLCTLLDPYVAHATRRSYALTVPQTVCIALRYFATGTYLHSVGDAEDLSKNTVCRAVRKVVFALIQLLDMFVVFPGHLPILAIKEGFYDFAGFPRVVGAIDCTHIPISAALGEHEGDFVNRKSFHSINVQMTCDHQLMVTSLDARWPGSVHDSRIFRESALGHQFEHGHFDGILLGDRGYACMQHLMTPYPDPQTRPQSLYNVALNRTRVRIETTFGVIKSRFNCLRGLRVSPERACQVVAACVVLHNIAIIRKERAPYELLLPPDVMDPITLDHPTGRTIREAITEQYFT